jgi:hypothetical protein
MWTSLSRADIEAAQAELKTRREQMLIRHAQELKGIDNDKTEIELLDRLLGAFFAKFQTAASTTASSAEPGRAPPVKPQPVQSSGKLSYPNTLASSPAFGLRRAMAGTG